MYRNTANIAISEELTEASLNLNDITEAMENPKTLNIFNIPGRL
jgi:hypothetical protein